jgi:hypothetical protein
MNRLTIFTGGLLLFGAGFLVGHYGAVGTTSGIATAKIETRGAVSQAATPKPMQNSLAKTDHLTQVVRFASNSKPGTVSGSVQQTPSKALPPSHEMALTAEEQAQLVAQQWEAKQANISQMEAMIQSMEEGNAPAEDIKQFRELKRTIEEQLIEEPQASEANPPVRTEDELKNDFAASLEQAGMPPAERDKMLEAFSPPPESIPDSTDAEPTPPHEQEQ